MKHLTVFFFLFVGLLSQSQTADYVQSLNFSLSTNPAYAGTNQDWRIFGGYRTKYVSLSNPFVNYYASVDVEVEQIKSGVGLAFYREEAGETAFLTHNLSLFFSKTIALTKKTVLKLGLNAGLLMYGLDAGGLTTQDMIEDGYGFIYPNTEPIESEGHNYLDLSAGGLIYGRKVAFGFALKQLAQSGKFEQGDTVRHLFPLTANIHLNLLLKAGNVDILPLMLIRKQRLAGKGSVGLIVRPKPLIVGVALNLSELSGAESFSTVIGFIQKKYKFAYNCDWSMNPATGALFDIHEISITIYPGNDKKKPSAISCPGLY